MIPFTDEKLKKIKSALTEACQEVEQPIAAFDADGTLWEIDMGEAFFDYQINQRLVELPEDPWDHYLTLKAKDHPAAYLWLAQINKGVPETQLRQWAKQGLESVSPVPTFDAQKEIIDHLYSLGAKVYVVTASIKWAVEPAAALYGIPHEQVIGITTKVIDGKITDEKDGPITWRSGKVDGLLHHTQGQKPFFASGNTTGDLALLESASHHRLVIATAKQGDTNFETERKMIQIAQERGWFHHSYL